MQKLLVMLLILLNCNQHVKCGSIFEYMYYKLIDIKDAVIGSLKLIPLQIHDAFVGPRIARDIPETSRRHRHISPKSYPETMHQHGKPDVNLICKWSAHSLTTPQISATNGRIMETHVTYTSDGYILTLHRLHSSTAKDQTGYDQGKRTVLLYHGLLGSSADWILLGPNKSLPYILSDAGHDVWLANARGNYYSRHHVSMDFNSEKYWNFSWEEIGEYDLPATLDYIRKVNNSTKPIDYIGHSMGATALLVLLSAKRTYNSYFRLAVLLAPLAFMTNTRGPLQNLATINKSELAAILGTREFMPARRTYLSLSLKMCHRHEFFCDNPLFFLIGSPLQKGTCTIAFKSKLHDYTPAGGSAKTIRHYLDLIHNGQFHRYGKPDRKFNLKFVVTPIFIFSSTSDLVSNKIDNQHLYLSLSNPVGHIIIADQNLSHSEFVWGFNADVLLYNKIKDFIDIGPDVNEIFR